MICADPLNLNAGALLISTMSVRKNPEHFRDPEEPGQRSRKSLSEYRRKQDVHDVRWEPDRLDDSDSDGEADPDRNLRFADSEDHEYSGDTEGADSFDDFPDTPDGSDVGSDRDVNDDGPCTSNSPNCSEDPRSEDSEDPRDGHSEEEEYTLGSSKGKGKEPSALSDAMVQAMIKTLSDNPDAFYRNNNLYRRRKLWEAFAKSNPNYSAQAYIGYHQANHKKLERAAKNLDKPVSFSDLRDRMDKS
ncbi:hypothetical protein FRC01_004673, partial [Tulasnella sp. 417]